MKKAFTLMEVNLAIGILALGIMSIISLYSFSYREGSQSNEDVAAAAYAEAVLSQLTMALSSTNCIEATRFRSLKYSEEMNESGWSCYMDGDGRAISSPESLGRAVFDKFMGSAGGSAFNDNNGLKGALVIQHDEGSRIVRIGFRATREARQLFAQPLYYTEVCYPMSFDSTLDEGVDE